MEGKGGVRFEFFVEREDDFAFVDADDFGAVEEAASDDIEDLAGSGAEYADEVGGLVAGQGSGVSGPGVGDPATARHCWSLFGSEAAGGVTMFPVPMGMVIVMGP